LAITAATLATAGSVATVPSSATPTSEKAAVGVVVAHGRTEAQIRSTLAQAAYSHHGLSASYAPSFATPPSYVSPYVAGELTTARRNDALRALKAVRYLAGVPTDVSFTPANNRLAQHCAVLLAASGQFTHFPSKPADMSDDFFAEAEKGCRESNLYGGISNLSNAVLGWAADPGANNLGLAGHRGWEISTAGATYGIGYGTYSGRNISALHVFDNPAFPNNPGSLATSYVAWPNSGAFPLEYFWGGRSSNSAVPWSVYLGNAYQAPDPAKVSVVLVRARDGRKWRFTPATQRPDGSTDNGGNYLNVNPNQTFGMARSILFRPSLGALGTIRDGDRFTVTVRGIKDAAGDATTLRYATKFFRLG
jgi:hypothetical protein